MVDKFRLRWGTGHRTGEVVDDEDDEEVEEDEVDAEAAEADGDNGCDD